MKKRTDTMLHKLLGWIILLGSFVLAWLYMDIESFKRTPLIPGGGQSIHYRIISGTSLTRFASDLEQLGLLEHPHYLVWLARWQNRAKQIKAGEYLFQPGTTPLQMLDQIVAGKVIQYPLTIIEGWTFQQLLQSIADNKNIQHELTGLSEEIIMKKLGWPEQHPEGRFYPDTYHVTKDMKDTQLLQRAYQAMAKFLGQAWDQRDDGLPYDTPYQALIMASIIEKETAVAQERRQIAGVFVRRLQRHMRLQADPTVIYGLGKHFDGNLRRRDLKKDTRYNTYVHKGLPPTPIAMPGKDAILAALHPDQGRALYFVARGDGRHYFSSTIEEHNQAVRKFQLKR